MSDWYTADVALQATIAKVVGGPWQDGAAALLTQAATVAKERVAPLAWMADKHPPTLRTHDPFGERIDDVSYHPAALELERIAYGELGLVAMKYDGQSFGLPEAAPQVLSFAALYLFAQGEAGLPFALCTTDGAARMISRYGDEALRRDLLPRLIARTGESRTTGAMFLSERGAGSDVGQIQTVAVRDGSGFRLSGDKWFCSNVDAGVIMTLARVATDGPGTPGTKGLGLFVVEPNLPDGRKNGLTIHRLKDQLGVRSVATGEVSFRDAWARQVGAIDNGFKSMTEMINLARLYSSVISVALMRRALTDGLGWISARQTFGKRVVDHPLAIETVADLSAETQGALHLVFDAVGRLGLIDQGSATTTDRRVLRLLTPLCKYYTARLAVWAAGESLELQGGNGYIEEFVAARLLRDAQALPIRGGTTNICLLDVLRALSKTGTTDALFSEAERKLVAVAEPRVRKLAEVARRQLDRVARSLLRLTSFSEDVLQHHARLLTDALVQSYEVALCLSEADRLDEYGQGGRDYLVAERLLARHLDRPTIETVGPRHIDPLRLQVLLGERAAHVADVA